MSNELTPAQSAQIPLYVAKYTSIGLRHGPEGSTDRKKAALAAERFLRSDPENKMQKYEWIDFDPTDPFFKRRFGKMSELQDLNTMYIITGIWDDLIASIRKILNKTDISNSLCVAQHAVHAAADAMFQKNVLHKRGDTPEETAKFFEAAEALDDFCTYCGVANIYEKAIFIGDSPVAYKKLDDGSLDCYWRNSTAHAAGLTDVNGVSLSED
jgi:hypothetical protein